MNANETAHLENTLASRGGSPRDLDHGDGCLICKAARSRRGTTCAACFKPLDPARRERGICFDCSRGETFKAMRIEPWAAARTAWALLARYAIAAENGEIGNDGRGLMSSDAVDANDLASRMSSYDYRWQDAAEEAGVEDAR